jgi:hypothetical protein
MKRKKERGIKMKLKRLTMVFAEPLTKIIHYQDQDVTQLQILETDILGIKMKVKSELEKVLRGVNMVRILNPTVFDAFKMHVKNMEYRFEWMVSFNKISDTKFEFVFPGDTTSLIYIQDISKKLGPLKRLVGDRLNGKDLALVQVLREKELETAFTRFSFVSMKLKPEDYSLSFDEFESDPERPTAEAAPVQPVVAQEEKTPVAQVQEETKEVPQPPTIAPEATLPAEKKEEKNAP